MRGLVLFGFGCAGLVALMAAGCSDGDGGVEPISREQGIAVLTSQGFSEAAAECTIDGAKGQDVDLLEVFARDELTQREYDVMTTVGDFCVEEHGTTGTSLPGPIRPDPTSG